MATSLPALNALNFFMADVRDGLGPFLGVYLQQQKWSPGEIGLVMTIGGLAGMAATTPLGALVDRTRAKRAVLVVAAIAIVLGSALLFLWPSFAAVTTSQVITGIAGAAVGPAIAGITLGIVRQRGFANQLGRNEAYNHGGNVFAAVAAGLLGYLFGLGALMISAETPPPAQPRRNFWRAVLLILLLIPAIPAILILMISIYGGIAGCDAAGGACIVGGRSLGEIAKNALDAAAAFATLFVFLGAIWFALCLFPIHRSFANAGSRLTAALFVAGWSVIGAIIMGLVALAGIAPHCSFNEGGVGTCRIFGVATQTGHQIGTAIWGIMLGMPTAAVVFVIYAVAVTIIANRNKPKTLTFPPRS